MEGEGAGNPFSKQGFRSSSSALHHPPVSRPRVNTHRLEHIPVLGQGWGCSRAPAPRDPAGCDPAAASLPGDAGRDGHGHGQVLRACGGTRRFPGEGAGWGLTGCPVVFLGGGAGAGGCCFPWGSHRVRAGFRVNWGRAALLSRWLRPFVALAGAVTSWVQTPRLHRQSTPCAPWGSNRRAPRSHRRERRGGTGTRHGVAGTPGTATRVQPLVGACWFPVGGQSIPP